MNKNKQFNSFFIVITVIVLAVGCDIAENKVLPQLDVPLSDTVELKKGWLEEYDYYVEKYIKEKGEFLLKYNNDISYWRTFFCGLAGAESDYKPWAVYWEDNLGVSCLSVWPESKCNEFIKNWNSKHKNRKASKNKKGWDKVTKTFYLSEGIFQLSYSDKEYYGCSFNWEADKFKPYNDHSKTIFDPEKNIECGVIILNSLLKKKGTVFFNSGHYWSVLKPENKKKHKRFQYYFDKCKCR